MSMYYWGISYKSVHSLYFYRLGGTLASLLQSLFVRYCCSRMNIRKIMHVSVTYILMPANTCSPRVILVRQ